MYFNLLNHQLQVQLCPVFVCEERLKPDQTVPFIFSGHFLTKNVLYEEITNESGCLFNLHESAERLNASVLQLTYHLC